jgi:endonuclease/exonuclease/phosphatase family metal-dependent hydrolase
MRNQAASPDRIRLVSWNIEKGKRWQLLEKCLEVEVIRSADVLCLNEVDDGMARSGNRRIAHEIGQNLGMAVVFGQTFKELTKGVGDERFAPGENTTAVQGNAILSRLPILGWRNLRLPVCHDPNKSEERREGGRCALIASLDCGGRALTVVSTHLEVFKTMDCRRRQMKFLLDELGAGPAVIAGDFNTNTFQRGSAFRTFQSLFHLLRKNMRSRAMQPSDWEPLFRELRHAGFSWNEFNDASATCSVDLASLEDRKYVPNFLRKRILKNCRILPLRLDFITCRGLRALSPGRTITDLPCQPSDHLPITCDLWLQP